MKIQALIFDFDGLILDTEMPDFAAWVEIYEEHGCELPISEWAKILGGAGASPFDPCDYLEAQAGRPLDKDALRVKHRTLDKKALAEQQILPGVENYIADAKRLGLKLAVASSSAHSWVDGHLQRLALFDHFDVIKCADDVPRTKPDPALFLAALAALGVEADSAIVLEDSPNGALAANRAGIYCVAVPNPLTRQLSLAHADLQLDSLADLPLEALIQVQNEWRVSQNPG